MAKKRKQGFGVLVARLLKPRLRELGFRPRKSSRVLYERPCGRGLIEYALWVYHYYGGRFHIQWGLRHQCSWATYGYNFEFAREKYLGFFEFTGEDDLPEALSRSFERWREEREAELPSMEKSLRTNRAAKPRILRWHEWWREFDGRDVREDGLAAIRSAFSDGYQERVTDAWAFIQKRVSPSERAEDMLLWKCFALLKEVQRRPDDFEGDWWQIHSRLLPCFFLFEHFGNLDALLEPFTGR